MCRGGAQEIKRFFKVLSISITVSEIEHYSFKIGPESVVGTLFCPIVAQPVNPYYFELESYGIQWALENKLIERGDSIYKKLEIGKIELLCALSYPKASKEDLKLAIEWITFLFIFDDRMDDVDTVIGKKSDLMKRAVEELKLVISGGEIPSSPYDKFLCIAMHKFYEKLSEKNKDISHFLKMADGYLDSCIEESITRESGTPMSSNSYKVLRMDGGAAHTVFELGFLMDHVRLPPAVRKLSNFERMFLQANGAVCFANDVYSCPKEVKEECLENLAIILHGEKRCSWNDAVADTAEQHDGCVKSYFEFKQRFVKQLQEKSLTGSIENVFEIFEQWMKGNIEWSSRGSNRYK